MTNIDAFCLRILFKLLSWMPIAFLRLIGDLLGYLLWPLKSRSRLVTQENIAACFPLQTQLQQQALAKKSLQHLAKTALELGSIWCRPVSKLLDSIVEVEGEQHIQDAFDAGRGVIILAPHIGAWELLGLYIAEHYPLTCLYQPPKNSAMHDVIVNSRTRTRMKLAPTNIKGVKILLQTLKQGEMVAILPDQVPPKEGGEFSSFFGVPALTTTLPRNLAKRSGAKVITAAALRVTASGHFKIVFQAVSDQVTDSDVGIALATLNQSVEAFVNLAPEQYQWEYKRFKRQPVDGKRFYQF
jgi:KDO2-lipid IV(A) lauroyltransferase